MADKCIVAIELPNATVKAFDICIGDKGDVYVNYSMAGLPEAHASYHASGQQHIKKAGKYVEWDAGPSGQFEQMKLQRTPPRDVITRSDCGSTIGWDVPKLKDVLPALTEQADMQVDARTLANDSILAFQINVIGAWARPHGSISGFPIIKTHRFGTNPQVEVNAFVVSDLTSGAAALEAF